MNGEVFHLTCSCSASSQPVRLLDAQTRCCHAVRARLVVRSQQAGLGEPLRRTPWQRVRDRLRKGREKKWLANFPERRRELALSTAVAGMSFLPSQLDCCALLHLHWVAGRTIDWEALSRLPVPMAMTLHDCWALTAACHYPFECTGYVGGCRECPQLGKPSLKAASSAVEELYAWKKRCMDRIGSLTVITPSDWLKAVAEESLMFRNRRVVRIYNPLDTDLFCPGDKREARARWGLPEDATVLCFGCVDTQSPYKGGEMIAPVLERLRALGGDNVHLLVFGTPPAQTQTVFPCTYTGYLHSMEEVASVYRAADVLLNPSRADVFSYVAAESQACGVPCAAFATGGIPEVVVHEQSGLIAPQFDLDAMAHNLFRLIADAGLRGAMGRRARDLAVERFSYPVIAAQHEALYEEITARTNHTDSRRG